MNPTEDQIEKTLRQAPQPAPPPGLRRRLVDQIELTRPASLPLVTTAPNAFWFQRWRLALAMGGAAAISLVVLGYQQARIDELQSTIQVLQHQIDQAVPPVPPSATPSATGALENGVAELERLRAAVGEIGTDVTTLEGLAAENSRLKAEAAASVATPEEIAALTEAREKAQRIQCVNNLKQIGLAARVWATDNDDVLPPDLLSMSNELTTPKILVCPSDASRTVAANWAEFSLANTSYEFLAPSCPDSDPTRVAFRCTVHHNVALVDGSVQQLTEERAANLVHRDGGLYMSVPANAVRQSQMDPVLMERYGLTAPTDPSQPAPTVQMDERMMRRYGLLPAGAVAPESRTDDSEPATEAQPESDPSP